jgi:hypothetical protein
MTTYLTTAMKVAIHRATDNPDYGEGVTHLALDTDGAGWFLHITQPVPFDHTRDGISVNPEELEAIADAARFLLAQQGAKEHDAP